MNDDNNSPGYAASLAELDAILADLDHDRVDIDQLGATVERASVLIEGCRRRLDTARASVQEIVAGLEAASENADDERDDLSAEPPESPGATDE